MNQKMLLEQFGLFLMREVRYRTIEQWEMILEGRVKGIYAEKAREVLLSRNIECSEVINKLIPHVVDTTIAFLLASLDEQENIEIFVADKDNVSSNLRGISDGLEGELYGENGWFARFSQKSNEEYLTVNQYKDSGN
jgi:hypothetical protein